MRQTQPGRAGIGGLGAAAALVALVAGAACSSSPATRKEGESRSAAVGGVIPVEKVKTCAGFTAETAGTLLGVPPTAIEDHSSDVYDKLRSCSYVDSKNPGTSVTFSLRRDDSVQEAADEMASFRDHLGVARGVLPANGASAKEPPFEEVPGLGDEAVWTRVNDTLNVRLGNVSIQVSGPPGLEAQRRVALKVLEGLR
jgi:hypothetical protein